MKKIKYKIPLSISEYKLLLQGLIYFRNKLIEEGRYADAIDELICKISK